MKCKMIYFVLFVLIFQENIVLSINPVINNNINIDAKELDKLGEKFIEGISKALADPKRSEDTKKFLENIMKGSGKTFQEGGEFDILADDLSKAGGRFFSSAMGEASNQFEEGSNFDLAQKELSSTVEVNLNNFIQKVGFNNMIKYGIISLGITSGYYAIPVLAKYIENQLLNPRPKLIIESSKKSWMEYLGSIFGSSQLPLEMVFSSLLKKQLDDIIKVTSVIHKKIKEGKTNVKYRNLLLYGPPGTGKTMFAKQLAKRSGLEYAFMSGSSFSKFKDGEGIIALDELFAWANRSTGLLIFIDEAENFLSKRENMDPQSKAYQLLNNFLNYTGERSNKFMFVFATNHKNALDSAMYRRIDDLIEMPLPSEEQRIQALILYKDKILLDTNQNDQAFIDSVQKYLNDDVIKQIGERTKGLSYGDLEGIINTLQTDAQIQEPSLINKQLVTMVVERAIKKHQAFTNGQTLGFVEN
ncbi:MAG: AAA family ATPase [Candidatus Chromulinivorax sp.]